MTKPILLIHNPRPEETKRILDGINASLGKEYHAIVVDSDEKHIRCEVLRENKLSSKRFNRVKKLLKLNKNG